MQARKPIWKFWGTRKRLPEHIYDLSDGIDQLDFELVPSFSAISQNFKQQHTKRLKTISLQPKDGVSARVQNLRGLKTPQTVLKFLSQLPRRVCSMAIQLKSGHFPTNSYLYRFKYATSDKCTSCNVRDNIYYRLCVSKIHFTATKTHT